MNLEDVRRVLILGAGTMGCQIGLQCALHGYDVTVYDVDADALAAGVKRIEDYVSEMEGGSHKTPVPPAAARQRIRMTTDAATAANGADLLSESVPEDPSLKAKVFAQFNNLCPEHTVFTTNTSMLVPSIYAAATGRPAQFAAFHFHNPVWYANVVDVMPHPGTATETTVLLEGFARRIGQIPIVLQRESNGYVFNAMLSALNREALTLAANGVASVQDIDRAWMGIMKMPAGPFGILDQIGLETAWHITAYWANITDDDQLHKNAAFLRTYLDRGLLGMKSGEGFYKYPDPAYRQPGFVEGV
jgi:3-hydroxybutyryl-CoA dehydrogenase